MAFVELETYKGDKVQLSTEHIQGVTSYNFYDHDKEVPAGLLFVNSQGLAEVRGDKLAEADAFRTSERTLVLLANGSSYEVKGTVKEVMALLKVK